MRKQEKEVINDLIFRLSKSKSEHGEIYCAWDVLSSLVKNVSAAKRILECKVR